MARGRTGGVRRLRLHRDRRRFGRRRRRQPAVRSGGLERAVARGRRRRDADERHPRRGQVPATDRPRLAVPDGATAGRLPRLERPEVGSSVLLTRPVKTTSLTGYASLLVPILAVQYPYLPHSTLVRIDLNSWMPPRLTINETLVSEKCCSRT